MKKFVLVKSSPAYAEQTDTINATKIVNASKDKVWNIISDVDKNPDYWPISIVKNINKSNNTVEREVTIPAPPFMDNKVNQIITINPEQFTINENQTQGAVTGVKTIYLLQVGNDANKTEVSIVWNLDLSKIPGFVGNIEPQALFSGAVDVVVTDGFTGNVLLKTAEGVSEFIFNQLKKNAPESLHKEIAKLASRFEYADFPGARVVGVAGSVIKIHGSAGPEALSICLKALHSS